MTWIIKIENRRNLRIKVIFLPLKEMLGFYGQYKLPNNEWVDFSELFCSYDTAINKIQDLLYDVYNELNKRATMYENVAENFQNIKSVVVVGSEE